MVINLCNEWTTFEYVTGITVYIFLAIILLYVVLYNLSFKTINNEGAFKIVGGLSVFIVAILSQNGWVFFASLFIGGLIIASEEFMKSLAAILKSDSKNMPEVLKALIAEKASPKEIQKKRKEEASELKKEAINTDKQTYVKDLKTAEMFVKKYLLKQFGERFQKGIKVNNTVLDGIIEDKNGNLESVVEIRYNKKLMTAPIPLSFLGSTIDKIRSDLRTPSLPILICQVANSINSKEIDSFYDYLRRSKLKNVEILFLQLREKDVNFVASCNS